MSIFPVFDSFGLCMFSLIQNLLVSGAGDQCPVFSDHLPAVLGHSEYDPGVFDDSSQVDMFIEFTIAVIRVLCFSF